jgi:hypothetical protein
MAYEKAAIRHAREAREGRERREQQDHARIAAVIAEFDSDLARMAKALLDYRHILRQFIDAGEMIQQGKPFIVMGPGPHWEPDPQKQWPRR